MYIDRIFGTNQWAIWVPTGPGDAEPFRGFGAEFFVSAEIAAAFAEAHGIELEQPAEVPYDS